MTTEAPVDLLTLGRRIRHLREARRLTLVELGERVGCTASHLSTIENGRREPRLRLLHDIATALSTPVADLLQPAAPSRRAALEISLEQAQRDPAYLALGLPDVRPGRRLPTDVLEALVGLHAELRAQVLRRAATPEEARRANVELRKRMRERDNYYEAIEQAARPLLDGVRHTTGPLTHQAIESIAENLGFTLHHVSDLPRSTRSVSDLRHRRIYLPRPNLTSGHDPRIVVLQTLGHFVLGHADPVDYADFLRQRVEANYFAAAMLMPEASAVDFLQRAKQERDIAVEDLRDMFAVSYETAAHRFTNLATARLGIPVHFMKVHESGTIIKAYENDSVSFPSDALGAIEGTPVCRSWTARTVFDVPDRFSPYYQYTDTPRGTFWCTSRIEKAKEGVRFYQTTLFDASEDADKATMTTVVIGDERKTAADDPERAAMGKLADDSYWPVQIAYYDLSDGDGDETPNYRISFKLHANGITRGLAMDYGDFSMTGRLVRLDLFDHAAEGCGH